MNVPEMNYAQWFDFAKVVQSHSAQVGRIIPDEALRPAALAAVNCKSMSALVSVLETYERPRESWR